PSPQGAKALSFSAETYFVSETRLRTENNFCFLVMKPTVQALFISDYQSHVLQDVHFTEDICPGRQRSPPMAPRERTHSHQARTHSVLYLCLCSTNSGTYRAGSADVTVLDPGSANQAKG
ncbi:hypothetical protein J6590_000661, partial [Homalodisca vitripennis]